MSKKNLLGDTVLRRDHEGKLHLMNRKEGGFRSWAMPIDSEEVLLALYNVRLGAWDRDEHGEYCPVSRTPREEQPTLHDGEEGFKLHDFGPRGVSVVSDDINHEGLRKLLAAQHDFGSRGPVVVGIGSDLREYRRPGSDGEVLKVRMDSGTPEALDQMMKTNGLELVPVMVNGVDVRPNK